MLAGASFVGFGLFALVAPEQFFRNLAAFEPFNEHLIHDLGAFQIAIGAMLILVAWVPDGLYGALAGATIGAIIHTGAHIVDDDLGGNEPTTIPFLALIAGALLVATLIRARQRT
jgi:predicted DNA repair protein MutK